MKLNYQNQHGYTGASASLLIRVSSSIPEYKKNPIWNTFPVHNPNLIKQFHMMDIGSYI